MVGRLYRWRPSQGASGWCGCCTSEGTSYPTPDRDFLHASKQLFYKTPIISSRLVKELKEIAGTPSIISGGFRVLNVSRQFLSFSNF